MKKILALLIFLCVNMTFTQETLEVSPTQTIDKSLRYDPHSLGISFRLGGAIDGHGSYGIFNTVFELYTQERIGKTKYTPMVGIKLSTPLGKPNPYTYGGFRWGFIFGGSQYVFDMRNKETGIGWSMLVNGGFTAAVPIIKEFVEIARYPFTIGGEVDFKAIYNVHKYIGITFGLYMGYALGFTAEQFFKDTLEGEETTGDIADVDNNFIIGFNFGIIF